MNQHDGADLRATAATLTTQAGEHAARRAATTVLSGDRMRATVIALCAGAELSEHDAPPAATLQVLDGRVLLFAGDDEWLLDAGQLVPIPPRRHGLRAVTDTAVLLTVSLA